MHPTSICFFQWLSDCLLLDSGAHCQTNSRLCWTLCQLAKHSAVDPSNQGSSGDQKKGFGTWNFRNHMTLHALGLPIESHWHLRCGSVIRWDPRLFPSRFQFCQVVAKNLAALLVTGSNMQRGIATFAIKQNIIESPSSEHWTSPIFTFQSSINTFASWIFLCSIHKYYICSISTIWTFISSSQITLPPGYTEFIEFVGGQIFWRHLQEVRAPEQLSRWLSGSVAARKEKHEYVLILLTSTSIYHHILGCTCFHQVFSGDKTEPSTLLTRFWKSGRL